jgi:hypothetical protein
MAMILAFHSEYIYTFACSCCRSEFTVVHFVHTAELRPTISSEILFLTLCSTYGEVFMGLELNTSESAETQHKGEVGKISQRVIPLEVN